MKRYIVAPLFAAWICVACATPAANDVGTVASRPTASAIGDTRPTDIPEIPRAATTAAAAATVAPVEPTAAPAEPTVAPVEPTALPAEPTAAPVEPAAAPIEPTAAPVEPTAPTEQLTTPPTAPTTAPVANDPVGGGAKRAPAEILFLRNGSLIALDSALGTERMLTDNVDSFIATPNGTVLALVRGSGKQAEIWTIRRDGSALTQITNNDRADFAPSLTADGRGLVFASATSSKPYSRSWPEWGQWCATSEVHVVELTNATERVIGAGCDPAFAPDGKRIVYATPPSDKVDTFANAAHNTITMVNRQGQNGWSFAKTTAQDEDGALVVYGPSWSADGSQVYYHRFLGYQALVDLDDSMVAPVFRGGGQRFFNGAGWLLPAHQAPGGSRVAVIEDNYSDARGFGGYDNWSIAVVNMTGTRQIMLPLGETTYQGGSEERLPRAQAAAWSPDGKRLVVLLPPNWNPELPITEPIGVAENTPGELWLWTPGSNPSKKLASKVDFASPVVWLPAR